MTDLLNLLSVFGTCAEPDLDEWTCGEPVGYQGYDYSTVLIGEQCWFAENLRAEAYANGDEIASQLSESDWDGVAAGATAVYGDGDLTCYDYAPELDACGPGQSLSTFGRVYNWHSAVDERGLCPGGWQVPSDWDWSVMEQAIGMAPNEAESSGWRGTTKGPNSNRKLAGAAATGRTIGSSTACQRAIVTIRETTSTLRAMPRCFGRPQNSTANERGFES